jgi:hypothetical protein
MGCSMTENKDSKNVVNFPANEWLKGDTVSFDLEHRKIAIAASLVSILVVVTLANNSLDSFRAKSVDKGRGIANTESPALNPESIRWEHRLAKDLATNKVHAQAQMGQPPSMLDELRFGVLEGKYAVVIGNGRINKIEFLSDGSRKPKAIQHSEFFNNYKALLGISDIQTQKLSEKVVGNQVEMKYQIRDKDLMTQAEVIITNDAYGRLIKMTIVR